MSKHTGDDGPVTTKQKGYLKTLYMRYEGLDEKTAEKRAAGFQTFIAARAEAQRLFDSIKKKDEEQKKIEPLKYANLLDTFRGSLDYAEFLIDPKNKDTTNGQLADALMIFMEAIPDANWSMFRFIMLKKLQDIRKRAEKEERAKNAN